MKAAAKQRMLNEQKLVCEKYGSLYVPSRPDSIAGVAHNLRMGIVPLNGLRHPSDRETSGWYIWAGEYSSADDFFEPVHVSHLYEMCPLIIKFLGLAPGWRFLLAGEHVDVWFDNALLAI